ncbi:MAG: hypothetical protein ACPGVK_01775 [Halocynthiibacter sp.]
MNKQEFTSDGAKVTVYLDGPNWNNKPTATLGKFTCTSAKAGHDLLQEAVSFVRQQGIDHVIGPMDGDTWHSYRFVTYSDDSPAFLMEPTNSGPALEAFKKAGFSAISHYFSARVPLVNAAQTAPSSTDSFRIETWDGTNPEGLFAQVHALSTQAFSQNAFYKPISKETFLAMYMPLVPMLKRELIFFARRPDDTLAGFLFGTPNYAEGPTPNSVILKTYASLAKGAGQHLAYAFHQAARNAGYETAIHALIHDDNLSAQRSASEGADIFRRYALWGLRLND